MEVWQSTLMENFFAEISNSARTRFQKNSRNSCDWIGVTCTSRIITTLNYKDHSTVGNFSIKYAPNTVECLIINGSRQNFPIETRFFPKMVQEVDLMRNEIHGTVDFRTLPQGLCGLYLTNNRITAVSPIDELPPDLMFVSLDVNRIKQREVFVGEIPEAAELFNLKGNRIKCLKSLKGDDLSAKAREVIAI